MVEERIRAAFVARALRLQRYRRILAALGLGLTVFGWVAAADAACRMVCVSYAGKVYCRCR